MDRQPELRDAAETSHGSSLSSVDGTFTAIYGQPDTPMITPGRRTAQRRSLGFTALELMVAFGIIGLLLAILLPAVSTARQAARRAQCQNNLKQVGLALINYHEHFNVFPPGYVARDVAADDSWIAETGPGFAWGTMLLPFMDQVFLETSIDYNLDATDPVNMPVLGSPIHTLLCPASPTPPTFDVAAGLSLYMPASSNYVGVFGYGDLTEHPGNPEGPGAFYRNSSTTTWNIKDGLSNTVLISERTAWQEFEPGSAGVPANSTWTAAIPGADRPAGAVDHPLMTVGPASLVLGTAGMNVPEFESLRPNHTNFIGAFSSGHDGGLNMLRGDGSVRFTSDGIDEETLRRLMEISDGEITDAF